MAENNQLNRCCRSFLNWAQNYYWPIILVAAVLAAACVYYTLTTLTVNTSTKSREPPLQLDYYLFDGNLV
jgi:hypothetical protein